jgi:uncharacterized protein YkwD
MIKQITKIIIALLFCCSFLINVLFVFYIRSLNSSLKEKKVVFIKLDTLNEDKLWDTVQDWRIANNLTPYIKDEELCILARMRLPEIKKDWSHNGWLNRLPSRYSKYAENLARGYTDETAVLDAWLKSASHAANLKDNYTNSCIQTDDTYAVQLFRSF